MKRAKSHIIVQNDLGQALRVPEELIDIVVTNDLIVILLPSDELAIHYFIALIPHETVKRFNDGAEVQTLRYGIHTVLTLRTAVIIVGALENEAQTFRNKSDVGPFSPAEKEECYLPQTIIVGHVVHGIAPAIESRVQRFVAAFSAFDRFEALETGILGLTNSVIEIELCRKIPFPVVGMLTTNVIGVKSE